MPSARSRKGLHITFEIVEPRGLPAGTTVNWIVRNEGGEAEYINDLGHRAGSGFTASETRAAYKPCTHYMTILRRNGRIYGVRRIPVQISGVSAPLRNPVKQPAWVGLRARR